MTVEWTVTDDDRRLLVTLSGALGLSDVVVVRERLIKCLAEQPEALLLDISRLAVTEPPALAVFVAIRRQAARWPGIPMVLCAPGPHLRATLVAAAYRSLSIFPTLEAARTGAGIDRRTLRSLTDELLPIAGAARQARDIATDACLRWELPGLVAPASLIASELVSNVVDHAHTMMNLRLTLRDRYLHISVRDGSGAQPVPASLPLPEADRGRGLAIVEAIAHSWGWLPSDGGKVVWATLLAA
jgi:hypothetical protein